MPGVVEDRRMLPVKLRGVERWHPIRFYMYTDSLARRHGPERVLSEEAQSTPSGFCDARDEAKANTYRAVVNCVVATTTRTTPAVMAKRKRDRDVELRSRS
jgi:hypothetical protein